MRTTVLYWDPISSGHHERYLQAVIDTIPQGVRMFVPDWMPASRRAAGSVTAVHQTSDSEAKAFLEVLASTSASAAILGNGNELTRSLTMHPRRIRAGLVVVDLRSAPARMTRRHRTRRRDWMYGATDLLLREIAVRRHDIAFSSLIPDAVRGSHRLRRASSSYKDPLEQLGDLPSCKTSREVRRILVVGSLGSKKGIVDLAEAVALLPASVRSGIEVVMAGEPTSEGRRDIDEAVRILDLGGARIRCALRRLEHDEYSALISTADVVALSYRSHRGGSGVLGSTLVGSRAQIVVSDFGWVGRMAESLDTVTYGNLDVRSLSDALIDALQAGPRSEPTTEWDLDSFFGSSEDFGELIWSSVRIVSRPI